MAYLPWIVAGGAAAAVAYNYYKLPAPSGMDVNETLGESSITQNRRVPDYDKQSAGVTPTPNPGLGAQVGPNPKGSPSAVTVIPPAQSPTYPGPASTDHFGIINAPADYEKIVKTSQSWLTRHPASTPVTKGRGDPLGLSKNALSLANFHAVGKGEQYSGAVVPAALASLPVTSNGHSKGIQHPTKHAADSSRAEKSQWLNTLRAGIYPAVGVHPDSAHTSTNPHTQIKIGKAVRPSH